MSKSRVSPDYNLFQIVIQDFKHRKPQPLNQYYVDRFGRGKSFRDAGETIPIITKLKWAKSGRRAIAWAKKYGSVISCHKVQSHEHRLHMIEHLRIEAKPIEVEISPDEFIVGRDFEVEHREKVVNIEIEDNE